MIAALRDRLLEVGDRPMLIDEHGNARSGRELIARVERLAHLLASEGLVGQRIGVWYENSFAAFEAYLAVEWVAATRVVLDPHAAPLEATEVLLAAGASTLLADAAHRAGMPLPLIAYDDDSELGAGSRPPEDELPAQRILHLYPRAVRGGHLAAVPISYGNWRATIELNCRLYRSGGYGRWQEESEVMLTLQQLLHGTGLMGSFPFLHMGLPQVFARSFDPAATADLIDRHRVTSTGMTSAMLSVLLDAVPTGGLPSLRRLLYGGAPLGGDRLGRALDRLGDILVQVYGRLEGGWPLTILDQDDHSAIASGRADRAASCGRKVPDAHVELRTSAQGELCTRSPMAVAEYCDADGWCGLGDLGRIDASGYVFLNGRLDTMVNTGYHVYPEEVEEALLALPGVAAARVIGQPDERRGQILAAYVVAEPDTALEPEALRAALRGRLAAYKVPHAIWLVAALEQSEQTKESEVSR